MELQPIRLSRPMIKYIRKHKKKKELVGVEIGVAEGFNALNMLRVLPIKKLYLVDSYEDEWGVLYDKANEVLDGYKDAVTFLKNDSVSASSYFPDDYIDFCYIDASHDLKSVKKDFKAYYPKVKKGGIIGGHDFGMPWDGVIFFVVWLINNYGKDNVFTSDRDWWFVKL